jgi:hypothetical protein
MATTEVRPDRTGSLTAACVLTGLALSAVALATAPLLMPESYSWVAHTTSESAAQGVRGAWLARLGFVLFGLSTIALVSAARERWGAIAAGLHYVFGAMLIATAAFSTRPWTPAAFDATEDALHSVAATAMGFAFALGVVATAIHRGRHHPGPVRVGSWAFDVIVVVASVGLPLAMSSLPGSDGALQRLMFALAYLWYGLAAVAQVRRRP